MLTNLIVAFVRVYQRFRLNVRALLVTGVQRVQSAHKQRPRVRRGNVKIQEFNRVLFKRVALALERAREQAPLHAVLPSRGHVASKVAARVGVVVPLVAARELRAAYRDRHFRPAPASPNAHGQPEDIVLILVIYLRGGAHGVILGVRADDAPGAIFAPICRALWERLLRAVRVLQNVRATDPPCA
eukprot:28560-Pelagococcus_subviridis.AAC.2